MVCVDSFLTLVFIIFFNNANMTDNSNFAKKRKADDAALLASFLLEQDAQLNQLIDAKIHATYDALNATNDALQALGGEV